MNLHAQTHAHTILSIWSIKPVRAASLQDLSIWSIEPVRAASLQGWTMNSWFAVVLGL